jgi:hypothetical protein
MNDLIEKHEVLHVERMNDCTYIGSFFFLYLHHTKHFGVRL